jgi:hypothetical protein
MSNGKGGAKAGPASKGPAGRNGGGGSQPVPAGFYELDDAPSGGSPGASGGQKRSPTARGGGQVSQNG